MGGSGVDGHRRVNEIGRIDEPDVGQLSIRRSTAPAISAVPSSPALKSQ
jgi:hypothetical protein